MEAVKLIVSNKSKLQWKYGKNFLAITSMLKKMQAADKKRGLDVKIVYVDDAASLKNSGVRKIKNDSLKEYKRVIDDLYKKYVPVYIVILGAPDIVPFQEIDNPAEDDDLNVPSDLPYACDSPYSTNVNNFTGPSRVVGRIPDKMGRQKDTAYIEKLLTNSINHAPKNPDEYHDYFSVSAFVWKKSTELSLQSIFGQSKKLTISPNGKIPKKYKPFTKKQLNPLTHFYNCHGANFDLYYYGQNEEDFPEAMASVNLLNNIRPGTVVAAECCFGAQLFDHEQLGLPASGIATSYFENDAIAFLGSSTIAYGPADSQGLADLITQYFIKNILKGASTGRAFLEARQLFLTDVGPDLDAHELKTLAQFYLLGDPSVQPAECEKTDVEKLTIGSGINNTRKNLSMKGISLGGSIGITSKQREAIPLTSKLKQVGGKGIGINQILAKNNFVPKDKNAVYAVKPKVADLMGLQKKFGGTKVKFHTYIQTLKEKQLNKIRVLVVKENSAEILGWRVYESK
jgi:hypothetical protein